MKRRTINLFAAGCIVLGVIGLFLFGFKPLGWWPESESAVDMPSNAAEAEDYTLYKYSHSIDIDDSLKDLILDANLGDMEINWFIDGENRIELSGQAIPSVIKNIQEATMQGGTLNIKYNYKRQLWENIQLFNFNSNQHKHVVDIHVSKEYVLDRLNINLAMGKLSMNGGNVKQLTADCDMGEVILGNITAELVELDAAMGSVRTDNIDATVRVKASMGEVDLRNTQQSVDVTANAGSINIQQAKAHNIDAESDMGSVIIKVAPEFQGLYDLRVNLGDIHAPQSKNKSDQIIKVRADLGSINIIE